MKVHPKVLALIVAAVISSTAVSRALAGQKCVRVVTFDWSASLNIDPAQLVNNSDQLHATQRYPSSLVIFDNYFQVKPWLAKSWSTNRWTAPSGRSSCSPASSSTTATSSPRQRRLHLPEARGSEDGVTGSRRVRELITPSNITAPSKYGGQVFKTAKPIAELPLLLATNMP